MRVKNKYVLMFGVILAVLAGFVMFNPSQTDAAINPQINFQGKLTNPDGTNVTDGTYSIRFRIYTDATADAANTCSANSCKWEETQGTVSVAAGIFQVSLGSGTALPGSVDFNTAALYLGVKVGSDAEMTPRIQLSAAPYAFNSDKVDGLDASAFVLISPGSTQTGNIDISGNVLAGGTYNTNTFTGNSLTFGSASSATIQSASSQALNITANAASTISTSSGALTVQSGSGTLSLGTTTAVTANGALGITSSTSNALTLDSGTTGNVNLGTGANAKAVSIGNTTGATSVTTNIGTNFGYVIQAASSAILFEIDSTNSRVYVGNQSADATGVILILDTKNTAGDPTGVNGGTYYNSSAGKFRCYENSAWRNCLGSPSNQSSGTQSPAASSTTYLTGSLLSVPPGGLQVGSTFKWDVIMTKTAAGTAVNTFNVYMGTNGNATDTAVLAYVMGTETAVADTAIVTIRCTVETINAATGTLRCSYLMNHNLITTGFDNTSAVRMATSSIATLNTTTGSLKFGIGLVTGAAYAITIQQVSAESNNL